MDPVTYTGTSYTWRIPAAEDPPDVTDRAGTVGLVENPTSLVLTGASGIGEIPITLTVHYDHILVTTANPLVLRLAHTFPRPVLQGYRYRHGNH